MTSADIEVFILGPVTVTRGGEPLHLEPRQLAILALVALSERQEITVRRLGTALGSRQNPVSEATLRTYISVLRKTLGGRSALPPARGGRVNLRVSPKLIDYHRFNELCEQAAQLPGLDGVVLLRQARDLWRSELPLDGLGDVDVDHERDWLTEKRRLLFRQLITATLQENDPDQALADSTTALGLWPDDGEMIVLRWQAWSRLGRAEEIKIDFQRRGSRVSGLRDEAHRLIEEARRFSKIARSALQGPPWQVPPVSANLHGRDAEIEMLSTVLHGVDGLRTATVVGLPGIGKTLFSITWTNRAKSRFPDGVLYADMRGYSDLPPRCSEDVLIDFVRAFAVKPDDRSKNEILSLYRTLLADRKVLVLLDNATDFTQVRDLLPPGPDSRALITSRSSLITSETVGGFHEITLNRVTTDTGLEILREVIDAGQMKRESIAAEGLVKKCGGLPLALKLVASLAHRSRRDSLDTLLKEMKLMDLGDDGRDLRQVIDWSVSRLTNDSVQILFVMGVHPGPSIDIDLAAYLAGISIPRAKRAFGDLVRSSLIESLESNRFTIHDVIREYAVAESAGRDELIRERLLKYLMWAGAEADRAFRSGRDVPMEAPDPGAPILDHPGEPEAAEWFEAQYKVFMGVLTDPMFEQWSVYRWRLPLLLFKFQNQAGLWADAEQLLKQARIVDKQDLPSDERVWADAVVLRLLGSVQRKRGQHHAAVLNLKDSIDRCRQHGLRLDEAHAHQQLSVVHEDRADWSDALEHSMAAYEIYADFGDDRGIAHTLNAAASALLAEGRLEDALERGRSALSAAERFSDNYGKGSFHRNLLRVHQELGQHREAISHADAAIVAYSGTAGANEAYVQIKVADSYRALGLAAKWRAALARAQHLLMALPSPRDQDRATLAQLKAELTEPAP